MPLGLMRSADDALSCAGLCLAAVSLFAGSCSLVWCVGVAWGVRVRVGNLYPSGWCPCEESVASGCEATVLSGWGWCDCYLVAGESCPENTQEF